VEGERLGAGEILVTSVDREGTARGLDLDLIQAVRRRVNVPVIASGGVGRVEHVIEAFSRNVTDAVACALVLDTDRLDIGRIKAELKAQEIPV
jgi:cyclase